jgi:hypothetical protein
VLVQRPFCLLNVGRIESYVSVNTADAEWAERERERERKRDREREKEREREIEKERENVGHRRPTFTVKERDGGDGIDARRMKKGEEGRKRRKT